MTQIKGYRSHNGALYLDKAVIELGNGRRWICKGLSILHSNGVIYINQIQDKTVHSKNNPTVWVDHRDVRIQITSNSQTFDARTTSFVVEGMQHNIFKFESPLDKLLANAVPDSRHATIQAPYATPFVHTIRYFIGNDGTDYEGPTQAGKQHGQGVGTFPNSTRVLRANFTDGYLASGLATMTNRAGHRWEGNFDENTREFVGTIAYANGNSFEGSYTLEGRRVKGKLITQTTEFEGTFDAADRPYTGNRSALAPDVQTFIGEIRNGLPWTGKGKFSYGNGQEFDGEFKEGQPWTGTGTVGRFTGVFKEGYPWEGNGEVSRPDGSRFEGTLAEGVYLEGTLTDKAGHPYTGEFRHGLPWCGSGAFVDSSSRLLEGEIKFGKIRSGKLTDPDGHVFEGEYMGGKPETGTGAFVDETGQLFNGTFKYGRFTNGIGLLVNPDGSTFTGEIKDQRPWNGQGTYIHLDTRFEGELREGAPWNGTGRVVYRIFPRATFEGELRNGKIYKGTLTSQRGQHTLTMTGEFDELGLPLNAEGSIELAEFTTFRGVVRNGILDGVLTNIHNQTFEGTFDRNGAAINGNGTILTSLYATFEGEIKDRLPWSGTGIFRTADGQEFNGTVKDGVYAEGSVSFGTGQFRGKIVNGCPYSGHGSFETKAGSHFNGELRDGNPWKGSGKWMYSDGRVFEGDIENGAYKTGKLTHSDGQVFEGVFDLSGQPVHGTGFWDRPDGSTFQGRIRNGKFLEGTYTDPKKRSFMGTFDFSEKPQTGAGVYLSADGTLFEGRFDYGLFVSGKKTLPNGNWMEGTFDLMGLVFGGIHTVFAEAITLNIGKQQVPLPVRTVFDGNYSMGQDANGKLDYNLCTVWNGAFSIDGKKRFEGSFNLGQNPQEYSSGAHLDCWDYSLGNGTFSGKLILRMAPIYEGVWTSSNRDTVYKGALVRGIYEGPGSITTPVLEFEGDFYNGQPLSGKGCRKIVVTQERLEGAVTIKSDVVVGEFRGEFDHQHDYKHGTLSHPRGHYMAGDFEQGRVKNGLVVLKVTHEKTRYQVQFEVDDSGHVLADTLVFSYRGDSVQEGDLKVKLVQKLTQKLSQKPQQDRFPGDCALADQMADWILQVQGTLPA
ncbi:MAG: hypothetical protein AB7F28_08835 [Candidatus Margulisiibacteriota bacterium]